jgi:hypothetical protein
MASAAAERLLDWLALSPARAAPPPLTAAEWDAVLCLAYRHGVTAQLHRRLLAGAASGPAPRAVLQCAWLGVAQQRAATGRLEHELPVVLRSLRAAGITPILLKGAHLAPLVYAEPLLRPMFDFDLLVRPAELAPAEEALRAAGYTSERTESMADACADALHPPPLVQRGRYPIELHWTLAPPEENVRIDLDGLWERARPATVWGEPAYALCPEDALLHICLHATVLHLFDQGIRPLLDVAALLERHGAGLDWSAVETRARAWGVERSVYLLLALARRDAGAVVPDAVLAGLQPGGVPARVVDAARIQMLELPLLQHDVSTRAVALACLRPRLLWEALFSSRTAAAHQHGRPAGPLDRARYYLLRTRALARRYGGLGWQLVRTDRALLAAATGRIRRERVLQGWLEGART